MVAQSWDGHSMAIVGGSLRRLGRRATRLAFPLAKRCFMAIGLGGLNRRVDQSAGVRASSRIRDEPDLASDHKRTGGVLTRVVVDWQMAVFYITDQSGPVLVQICKRLAQFGLRRYRRHSGSPLADSARFSAEGEPPNSVDKNGIHRSLSKCRPTTLWSA